MLATGQRNVKCKHLPRAWIPGDFDPVELLPARLWPAADSARWFLGSIVRRGMYGHDDAEGFVRLSSRVARDVVGRRTWPRLLEALKSHLDTTGYAQGEWCRGYRLVGFEQDARRVPLREPELVARLAARHDEWVRDQESRLLPIHRRLRANQARYLSLAPEIDAAVAELPAATRIVQAALVRAIRERRAGFSVGSTGRLYNALCGIKRTLREHVRLAGEPVVGVDIRSCQPALLGMLCYPPNGPKGVPTYSMLPATCVSAMRSRGRGGADAAEFSALASSGCLYERLLSECERFGVRVPADDPRGWVKRRFLVDILNYAPSDGLRPVARVVRALWPSVWRFVRMVNCRGRALIGLLQRFESWLVIEHVAPRLVERLPVMTLHDAIYCRRGDGPAVRGAFEEAFSELGLALELKEE